MVRVSCLDTRGVRVVTKREAGCGGRGRRRLTSGAILGRRSRVVLAPQSLGAKLATMLAHRADDGGKRDGSPGRARISRKPLRREGRSVSACTCGLRALAHLSCAKRPRVQRAPGLPCALGIFEVMLVQSSGECRRENMGACFGRHAASLQVVPDKRAIASADPGPITPGFCLAKNVHHRGPQKDSAVWVPAFAGTMISRNRVSHSDPLLALRLPAILV
jgi:hypothetical protein